MIKTLEVHDRVVLTRCKVARNFFTRFVGLMGRKTLSEDEAICFPKCNSIHTFFMRIPIDVVLVAPGGEVVEVIDSMRPWTMIAPKRGVRHIIEMRAGLSRELGIIPGAKLRCNGVLV